METKPLPQDEPTKAAPKDRRQILGSVAALLAAPLVLGKDALVHTFLPQKPKDTPAEDLPRPRINPPAHSVKRG